MQAGGVEGAEPSWHSEPGRARALGEGRQRVERGEIGDVRRCTGEYRAVQWPDTDWAFWTVRGTQLKLHRWASEDHTRRFGDLFNLVYDPAFLMHAWERVSTNAGAGTAGVDRV